MYLFGLIQTVKIALAYFILILLLPALILNKHFEKESLTKRFFIFLVFGNIQLSSIVFLLAYLNLFTPSILLLSS